MKTYSLVFLVLLPLSVFSQKKSYLGHVHTPKGHLHVLLVFVRYENTSRMNSRTWPDVTEEGVLPKMAMGPSNGLFHADPNEIEGPHARQNLSDYYFKMSGGQFRLTGDIFPIQVPVTYIPANRSNFYSRQLQMNKQAVQWIQEHYPNLDWGRYDNRTNNPKFSYDNQDSSPDGIIDYIVFMHREKGSNGAGSPGTFSIPHSPFKIRDGHTGIKSYDDAPHNWLYFKHEFAHTLYKSPHYLGANSANGRHFYTQKGWGLMSAWHAPFFTANAWESWWLGWLEPQEITRSGTYSLKDYLTGRDAMRIPIPGTRDFLWIENHQKQEPYWDRKQFFYTDKAKGEQQSAPGIYMYVVSEPGNNRQSPNLNPFNPAHANLIKMYNAEGNYDYVDTGERKSNGFFDVVVMEKAVENPFAGQNDFQMIRWDYDRDGKIEMNASHGNRDKGAGEQKGVWAEKKEGQTRLTFGNTGDTNDAFVVGDELGLSGTVPITHFPKYNEKQQRLEPFVINGIHIRIGRRNKEGTYTLFIDFEDWELRKDQRWCGNLLLASDEGGKNLPPLTLKKGVSLSLDLSGTPDRRTRHPQTGTFTNPSQLVVANRRAIHIQKKAQFFVNPHTSLVLKAGSQLILEKRSEMRIRGNIIIEDGARVIVRRKAYFILENEASFQVLGDIGESLEIEGEFEDKRLQ